MSEAKGSKQSQQGRPWGESESSKKIREAVAERVAYASGLYGQEQRTRQDARRLDGYYSGRSADPLDELYAEGILPAQYFQYPIENQQEQKDLFDAFLEGKEGKEEADRYAVLKDKLQTRVFSQPEGKASRQEEGAPQRPAAAAASAAAPAQKTGYFEKAGQILSSWIPSSLGSYGGYDDQDVMDAYFKFGRNARQPQKQAYYDAYGHDEY